MHFHSAPDGFLVAANLVGPTALRLTVSEICVENYQNMHKSAKLCIKIQKCILGKT